MSGAFDGDSIEELMEPLLHIPAIADSKVADLAGLYVDVWDDSIFTAWAAIAGPFKVFLQVLDDDGQHELTVKVSPDAVTATQSEPEWYRVSGRMSVAVTKDNAARIRALEQRLRDEYQSPRHNAKMVSGIRVGATYTFASVHPMEGHTFDDVRNTCLVKFAEAAAVIEGEWASDDDQWDASIFTAWADIAGPFSIELCYAHPALGEDRSVCIEVTREGVEIS